MSTNSNDQTGTLIRRVLADIEPLMTAAFRAVDFEPPPDSNLDQAGLHDGGETVVDYLDHNEAGIAFEHLLYMIESPPLRITHRRSNSSRRSPAGSAPIRFS